MEHRRLGAPGFTVPALSFGTGTFGGKGEVFGAWGSTGVAEATRLVDICLDAGLTMFDTAGIYSAGAAEEVLGGALKGLGAVVWSPLGWGRLTGKVRCGQPLPERSRLHKTADAGPPLGAGRGTRSPGPRGDRR